MEQFTTTSGPGSNRLEVKQGQSLDGTLVRRLIEWLEENPRYVQLRLNQCRIQEHHLIALVRGLYRTNIQFLSLIELGIGEEGVQAIAAAIEASFIQKLNLLDNNVEEHLPILARGLCDSGVKELNLAGNGLMAKGIYSLASVLPQTTVQDLDLSRNFVGCKGALALARALPNSRLIRLDLDRTRLSARGTRTICKAVRAQPGMVRLTLSGNALDTQAVYHLTEWMEESSCLETLCLEDCYLSNDQLNMLAGGVAISNTIKVLNLARNSQLSNVDSLLIAMKTHRTLQSVYLNHCALVPPEKHHQVLALLRRLHSERAKTMTVLCSVYEVPRFQSTWTLPREFLRLLAEAL